MTVIAWPAVRPPDSVAYELMPTQSRQISPLTGAEQVVTTGPSRWKIDLRWSDVPPRDMGLLRGWVAHMEGGVNTCYVPIFERAGVGGTGAVNGGSQTGHQLISDGWAPSAAVLLAGDFFSVNGELKCCTEDANTNGAGSATLRFSPALLDYPANNDPITADPATGLFRLSSATLNSTPVWGDATIALVEVII